MPSIVKRLHLADFAALFVCGVLLGVCSGGLMNSINGWVSPNYFGMVFYYPGGSLDWSPQSLYWRSIGQGLLEGLVFGCIMAAVFTAFVFFVSTAACRFSYAAAFYPKIVGIAFLFWLVGGLNGVIAGLLFPNLGSAITGTPGDRLKLLWVGGSIYGVYFGNLIALIWGCVCFRRRWQQVKSSSA